MHIAIIGPPSRLRTELIDLLLHDGHTIHLNDPPSERQAFRSTLVHIGAIEQRVGTEDLTIAIGSEVDEADLQILPPSDASIGIIVHDLVDSMTDSHLVCRGTRCLQARSPRASRCSKDAMVGRSA